MNHGVIVATATTTTTTTNFGFCLASLLYWSYYILGWVLQVCSRREPFASSIIKIFVHFTFHSYVRSVLKLK